MLLIKTAFRAICAAVISIACLASPVTAYAQAEAPVIGSRAALYPIDSEEKVENGYGLIIRTYALKPDENPDNIPVAGFEKFGARYELSEVIKKENRSEDVIAHTETVSVNTPDDDMNEILKLLAAEIPYEKDGYAGKLTLDISTVSCGPAGYKTNNYTLTAKREYPNLSSSDTSQIPKTVTEKGVTYSLSDLAFKAQSENSIGNEAVASSYTAHATYTAQGSSKNVTGYVTAADYHGEISRTLTDETIYKVYFVSEAPVVETPSEPTPEPEPVIETIPSEPEEPTADMDLGWIFPLISILDLFRNLKPSQLEIAYTGN